MTPVIGPAGGLADIAPEEALDFDLAVIGGGLAGLCSAIAAARHGARTVLVQDRPMLGGNSSSEIRVVPHGAAVANAFAAETGIVHELILDDRRRNHQDLHDIGATNSVYDLTLLDAARAEENLTLLLNTTVRSVRQDASSAVTAVHASQLGSEREYLIGARAFIDATGDGTVGALAGAAARYGRESRAEHGESLAPVRADGSTLGSTIGLRAVNVGRPVGFQAPPDATPYTSDEEFTFDRRFFTIDGNTVSGFWWLEINDPFHQIHDNAAIRDELHRHALGIWSYLKNHSPVAAELTDFALDWIGQIPGKRESRRLTGDVVITQREVLGDAGFPDEIGYGGWWIDLHQVGALRNPAAPAERENVDAHYRGLVRVAPFGVPLRACYSANVPNLWLAGRCLSASHVGLGPLRVQLTLGAIGQAVGTAAAAAVAAGVEPREIADPHGPHLRRLQQALLRDDVRIIGIDNDDPDDLALGRPARASSDAELRLDAGEDEGLAWNGSGDGIAQVLPAGEDGIEGIRLLVRNGRRRQGELAIAAERMSTMWQREPGEVLDRRTVAVPADSTGWVAAPLRVPPGVAETIRLTLTATEGVEVALAPGAPVGTVVQTLTVSPGGPERANASMQSFAIDDVELPPYRLWNQRRRMHVALAVSPPIRPYGPASVTDGYAWPRERPHLWVSDPRAELPQWVEVDLLAERVIGRAVVSFDTDLDLSTDARPALSAPFSCSTDWRIEVHRVVEDDWAVVHREEGNHQRHREVGFDPVRGDRVRVVIERTGGSRSASVYEVRLYE